MIHYSVMTKEQAHKLSEVDRSEKIDFIYECHDGIIHEIEAGHECATWDEQLMKELQERFVFELEHGGMGIGAFDGDTLVGFGVLAHRFRGDLQDHLQVDLMYVSRNYRRQGIGTRIINELSQEARNRGAKYLYISSTETRSAVYFYKSNGSELTEEVDSELFQKEPLDIHMTIKL